MELEVLNVSGKKVKSISLPESIFGLPLNDHVLHTVVKAYRANRRQGTHATKTRSFVSGGGKKPFKQKGTGSARQGSTRAPQYKGGATVHGPQPRDYRQKTSRKLRSLAVRVALSDRYRHGLIRIIDDFKISSYSSKQIAKTLKDVGVQGALITDERKDDFLFRSARNLSGVSYRLPAEFNAEDVLAHNSVVMSETALNTLIQRLG